MKKILVPGLCPGAKSNGDFSTRSPISLYGATKLSSEVLALEFGSAYNFPVWVNRCGVMAGGGQFGRPDQGIIAYWIHSWLRKHPLKYFGFNGKGYQVRDCLHPRDLVPLLDNQMHYSHTDKVKLQNISGGIASAFSLVGPRFWHHQRFEQVEVRVQWAAVAIVSKADLESGIDVSQPD